MMEQDLIPWPFLRTLAGLGHLYGKRTTGYLLIRTKIQNKPMSSPELFFRLTAKNYLCSAASRFFVCLEKKL